MFVRDVMTPSPIRCNPNDTLDRVATLMSEHDCGFIPVCTMKKLVGVVTDRDITCRGVGAGKPPVTTPVSAIMTTTLYTVMQDDDVETAIDLMKNRQVRRLPVLDGEGNVVGIIAPSDLAPLFASTNVADFLLAVSYWSRKPGVAAITAA